MIHIDDMNCPDQLLWHAANAAAGVAPETGVQAAARVVPPSGTAQTEAGAANAASSNHGAAGMLYKWCDTKAWYPWCYAHLSRCDVWIGAEPHQ